MTLIAGIDGCRGGWLAVFWDLADDRRWVELLRSWAEVPAAADLVAVDMPIGLAERGPRACDILARGVLPAGRKSSVFPPPRRAMLNARTWAEAHEWGQRNEGVGLPRQSWGLIDKIREIDAVLKPADQARVRECHPELVFLDLNGGRALPRKKHPAGRRQRARLLRAEGFCDLPVWQKKFPKSLVAADDVLDAAACAVAGARMLAGDAVCLPADPPRDARGLRMEIWY